MHDRMVILQLGDKYGLIIRFIHAVEWLVFEKQFNRFDFAFITSLDERSPDLAYFGFGFVGTHLKEEAHYLGLTV